eukprot:2409790-Amphidinium_carterae.1
MYELIGYVLWHYRKLFCHIEVTFACSGVICCTCSSLVAAFSHNACHWNEVQSIIQTCPALQQTLVQADEIVVLVVCLAFSKRVPCNCALPSEERFTQGATSM